MSRVPLPEFGITPTRRGRISTPYEDITPRSLLVRTHSPIPVALLSFGLSLDHEVFAGCYQPLLPPGSSRRYLCESFFRCFIPYCGCPSRCIYLFLPPSHRPSPGNDRVGFQLHSTYTTSHGRVFAAADIS